MWWVKFRPTSLQGGDTLSLPATLLLTTRKKNPPAILDLPTRIQIDWLGFRWPSLGIGIIVWLESVLKTHKMAIKSIAEIQQLLKKISKYFSKIVREFIVMMILRIFWKKITEAQGGFFPSSPFAFLLQTLSWFRLQRMLARTRRKHQSFLVNQNGCYQLLAKRPKWCIPP